jgi:hypothetical protein
VPLLAPLPSHSITSCYVGSACYLTLAAHGCGAELLPRDQLMRGADWSQYQLESQMTHCYVTVGDEEAAAQLPTDWATLHRKVGGLTGCVCSGVGSWMCVLRGGELAGCVS